MSELLLMIGVMFQRPMLMGYSNATAGLIILTFAYFAAMWRTRRNMHLRATSVRIGLKILVINIPPQLMNMVNNPQIALQSTIILLTATLTLYMSPGLSPERLRAAALKILRVIVFAGIATAILAQFNFLNLAPLGMFEVQIKDRFEMDSTTIYFPFSTVTTRFSSGDFTLMRSTFWAIEPGIAVYVLLMWRMLEGVRGNWSDHILNALYLIALAATASSTAPIMFILWIFLPRLSASKHPFSAKKITLLALGVGIGWMMLMYTPIIGLKDKMASHGGSLDERVNWLTTTEGTHRYMASGLITIFYLSIRRHLTRDALLIYAASIVVTMMNAFGFTPMFLMATYMTLRLPPILNSVPGSAKIEKGIIHYAEKTHHYGAPLLQETT